ncbi:MAG: S8 family serine peptidase [Actinomycetota bacterium]|nr:S8 family serine peptidase [Actinomycetota bacterium]
MKKVFVGLLALAALAVAASASAAPAEPSSSARERVLVGFDAQPGAVERALVQRLGATVTRALPDADALVVEAPSSVVGLLARAGGVSYVEPDSKRYPLGLSTTQVTPSIDNGLYGLVTTNATKVHNGQLASQKSYTGAGIKACVADTGLDYTHPDIAGNYVDGIDTVSDDDNPWWNNHPNETHGTHVAGTVMGVYNMAGVYGAAYGATLHYARVLGPNGGYSSDIMAGVRWLVEQRGCEIVNLSLGGGRKSFTEERFYKSMYNKGALVVAAAGNDGTTKISYPAGYAINIAVGAVDRNNVHASFSNTGKGLDVSAPGVTVLSSVPKNQGSESSVSVGTSSSYQAYGLEYAGQTSGTTGTLVDCGLAKLASDCGAAPPAGFVALIKRGDISFADKVENAMDAGAGAAVIYNNVAGDFTGTLGSSATSDGRAWIPAVSTSDTTGATLKTKVGSSSTVTNGVSSWDYYSGTSMATPHTAGVLALIWSVRPTMANSTVQDHLFKTATNLGAAGYDTTYGYGLINASAAVTRAGG